MNKDEIKGKMDDVVGKGKRKIGEAVDDTELQGEGLGQQAKGKIQNAWGNVREGAKVNKKIRLARSRLLGNKDLTPINPAAYDF